jgi:hypothetical protein
MELRFDYFLRLEDDFMLRGIIDRLFWLLDIIDVLSILCSINRILLNNLLL